MITRKVLIGILVAILIGAGGFGAYYFITQRKTGDTPGNDINAIGVYTLTNEQKEQIGLPSQLNANLEVRSAGTDDGAVIRVLDVAPDPTKPADADGDGLSDIDEQTYGTDPNAVDTDGDLALDNEEVLAGLDPKNPDTLGTGEGDIMTLINTPKGEIDADKDGFSTNKEHEYGTDPLDSDSDDDGFDDKTEVEGGYNPNGPGTL